MNEDRNTSRKPLSLSVFLSVRHHFLGRFRKRLGRFRSVSACSIYLGWEGMVPNISSNIIPIWDDTRWGQGGTQSQSCEAHHNALIEVELIYECNIYCDKYICIYCDAMWFLFNLWNFLAGDLFFTNFFIYRGFFKIELLTTLREPDFGFLSNSKENDGAESISFDYEPNVIWFDHESNIIWLDAW